MKTTTEVYYHVEGEQSGFIHAKDNRNSFYSDSEFELAKQAADKLNINRTNKDDKIIVTKMTVISLEEKVY